MPGIRHDKRIRSRLGVRFGQNDLANIGFTEDISATGIFLKSAKTFPVNAEIRVILTTDDDHEVRFFGVVKFSKQVAPNLVWADPNAGMGVEIQRFVAGREYFDDMLNRVH